MTCGFSCWWCVVDLFVAGYWLSGCCLLSLGVAEFVGWSCLIVGGVVDGAVAFECGVVLLHELGCDFFVLVLWLGLYMFAATVVICGFRGFR